MEYEDELDWMRNRKRRPAVRQTEIKKQTVSRRYAEPEKRQGTRKRQEMRLEYEDFSDVRQADRSRKTGNSKTAGGSYMSGSSKTAGRGKQGNGQSKVHQMAAQNRKTRAQKKKKKQKAVAGILLIAVLVIGLALFFMKKKDDGYWTVAVFGVDSRDGNLEKDTHSDVEMICVVDKKTGEIRISSVFRDTYMQVSAEGKYHKINQAYFDGGHKQAVDALERNLDLQIDDYATFNWKAVADAITILGGIDIDISDSEFGYINGFITETVNSTGLGSHQLEHAGTNHLDGVQAVAYARLRLMDTDYNRTARQRLVLSLAMEKAKQADPKTLITVVNAVMPEISTSIGVSDVLAMAKGISKYHMGETTGFPFSRTEKNIGKKDCVIPLTLESNVVQLHQFLYPEEPYSPSAAVKKISAKIASDSGLGEVAENAPEAKVGNNGGTAAKAPEPQPQPQAPVDVTETAAEASAENGETETAESEESSTEEGTEEETEENIKENVTESESVEETTISQKPGPTEETENPGPAGTETDSEHAFPTPGV